MQKIVVLGLLLGGLATSFISRLSTIQQPDQPNILWITCEDMSPHLGCYGDKEVKTPNLDQLASEGIRYTHAYTTAGVCAPSRSAIITGMYQTSIGTQHMRTLQPDPYPHKFSPRQDLFRRSSIRRPLLPRIPAKSRVLHDQQREAGLSVLPPVTVWDESSYTAHWRKRPARKPFFSVFNLMITHESQLWMREKEPLLVRPEDVTVPAYYPDTKTVRHDIARQSLERDPNGFDCGYDYQAVKGRRAL